MKFYDFFSALSHGRGFFWEMQQKRHVSDIEFFFLTEHLHWDPNISSVTGNIKMEILLALRQDQAALHQIAACNTGLWGG